MNLIFTCGGTAGHINPAIAVANMMKERYPDCNILFIGAIGHMEEKLVPQAGYELKCLPGSGLSRGKNFEAIKKNLIAQLIPPVRWTQIVENMVDDGYTEFTEVGPGSVLQGLVSKVSREVAVESKSTL